MSDTQKHDVNVLKKELKRLDRSAGDECVMCRFALIFSFVVLILIVLFVLTVRISPTTNQVFNPSIEPFHSQTLTPADFASTSSERNQRIMELGQTVRTVTLNPAPAQSGNAPFDGEVNTSLAPKPAGTPAVPDGPPPVMIP